MERFKQVNEHLLRGGAPSNQELQALKNIWGVDRVVSLDLDEGLRIQKDCEEIGLQQLIIPIENKDLQEVLDFLLNNIDKIFNPKYKTFVHCHWGKDRTGLAVAMYRILVEGWSLVQALDEALSLDFGKGLSDKTRKLYLKYMGRASKLTENSEEDQNDAMAQVGVGESGATQIWRSWNPGGRPPNFHYDFNF